MIPKGLFTQIILIILAVGIALSFIRPTFNEIGENQDQISTYEAEIDKVTQVNQKLQTMVETIDSVSEEDESRLRAYMPDQVDPIAVMRDLETIVDVSGVILNDVAYAGPLKETADSTEGVEATQDSQESEVSSHLFNLSVEGAYSQLKDLLRNMEMNHYPLRVQQMTMVPGEGGFVSADIEVVTYSLPDPSLSDAEIEDNQLIYE